MGFTIWGNEIGFIKCKHSSKKKCLSMAFSHIRTTIFCYFLLYIKGIFHGHYLNYASIISLFETSILIAFTAYGYFSDQTVWKGRFEGANGRIHWRSSTYPSRFQLSWNPFLQCYRRPLDFLWGTKLQRSSILSATWRVQKVQWLGSSECKSRLHKKSPRFLLKILNNVSLYHSIKSD